jgi:hypothetical protein
VPVDDAVEVNDISQPPLSPQMDDEAQFNDDNDRVDEDMDDGNVRVDEDMDDDDSERENEFRDTHVGDVEAQVEEDDMDRDIYYRRSYASDSEDEGPEELDEDGFTAKEARSFLKVVGREHHVPFFRDLSLADKAIVDGGKTKNLEAIPSTNQDDDDNKSRIKQGLKFPTLEELQMWLREYAVKHHRPFKVKHSDEKKRYTVVCEQTNCPWAVFARPSRDG